MAKLKKVCVLAIIEFFQKDDETDDEMLNIVRIAIDRNVGEVKHIGKVKSINDSNVDGEQE